MPSSSRFERAQAELASSDVTVMALEVHHPDLPYPARLVHDTAALRIGDARYVPVAFRARLSADVDGRAPTAEIGVDNVGRDLMLWVDAAQGGTGATVRVMQVLRLDGDVGRVEWEVTTDVLGVRATQREVVIHLGYDPLLTRPAVLLRYDPETAPGLF